MRPGSPDQAYQGGGRLAFVACSHAIKCNHVIALIAGIHCPGRSWRRGWGGWELDGGKQLAPKAFFKSPRVVRVAASPYCGSSLRVLFFFK
jgi:hypothetical protein